MPLSKSKAARREALRISKNERIVRSGVTQKHSRDLRLSELPCNSYSGAQIIAHLQCGFTCYKIVAPRTKSAAKSLHPEGPMSTEFAQPKAVSDRNDVFHARDNQFGRRRFDVVHAVALKELAARSQIFHSRCEMGDFADDS